MHSSRTAADWLIVLVNVAAILLGLAIGWLWIIDALGHYAADDNHPNIRIGMCMGFVMAYLAWISVVISYLVLRSRVTVSTSPLAEEAPSIAPARPTTVQTIAPAEASKSSPPPVRAKPAGGAVGISPSPQWIGELAEAQPDVPDLVSNPIPPPASWIPDVASEEQARRNRKE
jgi:hypothetical protein